MRNFPGWSACLVVLGVLTIGCDSAGNGQPADGSTSSAGVRKQADGASSMVSAVSAGGGAASVDVKFELAGRPEVGKPVDIKLALTPVAPLERLYVRFQPVDGLAIVKGGQIEHIVRPATGSAIAHTLSVVPQRDGIFTILAVVLMDSEMDSVSRNFAIPLIAGKGLSTSHVESPENPAHR